MTKPAKPLDRLAMLHGIERSYTDVWRRRHIVAAATQRALLAAMGVPAANDAEVRASLARTEAAARQEVLPPVIVMRTGQPRLSLTLPGDAAGRLVWSIRTEDGGTERGEHAPFDLDVSAGKAVDGTGCQHRHLPVRHDLPIGYHRLEVRIGARDPAVASLIVAPHKAFGVAELGASHGLWGLTAPLYGLRSERNWGIGDFGDLGQLAALMAGMGAAFVGINPVHAQLPSAPDRCSPYAPSSRRFLNVLLIAIEQVPELAHSPAAQAMIAAPGFGRRLEAARAARLVDYATTAELKLLVLAQLFESLCRQRQSARWAAFEAYRAQAGPSLERQARFDALLEHFRARDPACESWHAWPEPYRDPASAEVARFVAGHHDRVAFFAYLQWLAQEQLEQAQRRATASGMPIGLCLDLAIGVDPDGAEAWGHRDSVVDQARLGAPPDQFNPNGQNWGLVPLAPRALRAQAYAPIVEIMRRSMRHAGALRIDHVLGLQRSFWWPAEPGLAGAYVRQPFDDLLALVALESHRQRCVVVGEDLGTIPRGLRTALRDMGLLGCRVLYFEREDGGFRPGASYPSLSVASIGTHDLPTLAGFWAGRDIDWRAQLGFYRDTLRVEQERTARLEDRKALLRLLAAEGLLPPGLEPDQPPEVLPWSLVEALHRVLARSPAELMVLQIEDALGRLEQANLPGTVDQHPNWRRRLDRSLAELAHMPRLEALAATIAGDRPRLAHAMPATRTRAI